MSTQKYYCDCAAICKRRKEVSRSTYYAHKSNRTLLSSGLDNYYASHGIAIGSLPGQSLGGASTDTNALLHGQRGVEDDEHSLMETRRKRRRLSVSLEPMQETGEGMLEVEDEIMVNFGFL
jgi:hypothetical protein